MESLGLEMGTEPILEPSEEDTLQFTVEYLDGSKRQVRVNFDHLVDLDINPLAKMREIFEEPVGDTWEERQKNIPKGNRINPRKWTSLQFEYLKGLWAQHQLKLELRKIQGFLGSIQDACESGGTAFLTPKKLRELKKFL